MAVLDRVFARYYDRLLEVSEVRGLTAMRQELLAPCAGTVVEIGAGTGLNLAHYPSTVDRLVLCEPTPEMLQQLEDKLRDDRSPVADTEAMAAPAEALPFADASVDHVVSTLVLCTVKDLGRAVTELTRIVRPGGTVALIEHIEADADRKPMRRRVQHVIEPVWKIAARGCHLTRDPRPALEAAGFDVSKLGETRVPGAAAVARRAVMGHAARR